jgi:hypothetical protein
MPIHADPQPDTVLCMGMNGVISEILGTPTLNYLSFTLRDGSCDNAAAKPYVFTHQGQEIKLCCKDCLKDFKKEPAKYTKKIEEAQKNKK